MSPLLLKLERIDRHLLAVLTADAVDAGEMAQLLNERKHCLNDIAMLPEPPEKEAWSTAVSRTQQIMTLIKEHRDSAAAQASRFIKGRKSVQLYKKFE
ncbi:hypothetical protein [Enterovibrio norvegicus]|uniref:hypothetical protein n=1 Tax=Enterovibrio norvegicus TaxID=188144 RepID=UPI0024B25020|nr:hypothetical protein [Enterovibrio norvegicus]